ncbi:hypothetical protein ACQ4PT_038401 [Festuca glaucescens]
MTTAPFVSPSLPRLYSARASPIPKSPAKSRAAVAFPARPYGPSLRPRSPVMAAAGVGGNGSPVASEDSTVSSRLGEVKRVTKETNVHVKINLDGTGVANCSTGIPFLDHMLDQLASHGLFDVYVKATGDTHIDDHHSNEDIALAIGTALLQALGDRKGINRFGHFTAPLDEAAVEVILDLSGRPHLSCGLSIPTARVGTYDTQLKRCSVKVVVFQDLKTVHTLPPLKLGARKRSRWVGGLLLDHLCCYTCTWSPCHSAITQRVKWLVILLSGLTYLYFRWHNSTSAR